MGRTKIPFASIIVGFLLLVPTELSHATTCTLLPIKPIRYVCGIVLNQLGEPIPNAKVTILEGITELASVQTNNDGKFSFEQLKAGKYDILVQADFYKSARASIVLVRPATKCKRTLQVTLAVGMACSSVGLANR